MRPATVSVYVPLQRALTEIWAEFNEREHEKKRQRLLRWYNGQRIVCRNFLYC